MYFYLFLIAISISIFSFFVLRSWLKPVTSKHLKFIEDSKKTGRSLNQYNWLETRDKLLKRIKNVNLSEEFSTELNRDLNRLGWQQTAEDIRKMQLLYSVLFGVLAILVMFISSLFGIIMIFLIPYIWNIPVRQVKKSIKERNGEFLINLDSLYSIIYNQYKRNNEEHLGNIISAYLPTTTPIMKLECLIFLRDIESGEEYALKQLKQRIPIPMVMRFCDIVMTNLEGTDNRDVMENFYMELKSIKDRRREKRNAERARKLDIINKSLYVPFVFLVVVYLIVSTLSNIE